MKNIMVLLLILIIFGSYIEDNKTREEYDYEVLNFKIDSIHNRMNNMRPLYWKDSINLRELSRYQEKRALIKSNLKIH